MTYLVGYAPDRSGGDALALGRMLAASGDVDLTVCMVVPETWGYPSPANVEAEYKAFLDAYSAKALKKARAALGPDVPATFIARAARTAALGLSQVANDISAEFIVLGSARDGRTMRCSLGSVAAGVLALTDRPVVLAPRTFKQNAAQRLRRITCAYTDDGEGHRTLATAVDLSLRHGVPLRLVTFVVRDKQMYPTSAGYDVENIVSNAWRVQAVEAQQRALEDLPDGIEAFATIGDGPDWKRAIAATGWIEGEVLVAGSHHMGTVSGFVFGTAFTRLLRYATVPLVAVP
ncbi:Nucleotide-binding universal stress protein, UspA family [Pseudoxanthobacter soli DSM 19599]|uniref:Nucleotide-binding universal stress protein, UspA family n=1 Tax=Pseudoxanthobacter soli DSM 19599 TaxID=1123029 RepID=A0A1M7Z9L7_9HYPH|nr:universal stress protein [Pseudoxanthobacter soli]SHO61585.1 Nucleotide-binding universal stress protein, UspA family [Pseudoxanthobacter soli DSM 19599]